MVELDQLIQEGALAAPHLDRIKSILEADVFEDEMGKMMRQYIDENVRDIDELATITYLLAASKIISSYNFRRVMTA